MKKILNRAYYMWRWGSWRLDPFQCRDKDVEIDRPIFLLGVQGGGLTLLSRILRRNKDVVSVTGNYNYWYGGDEIQNVLRSILPVEFGGIKYPYPDGGEFITPRGWLYASERLIDYYRLTKKDATPQLSQEFKKVIRWLINRHALSRVPRFVDKSQVFTVKVSFLNKILEGCDPIFVLVTRNPYALCYRSAMKEGDAPELKEVSKRFSLERALRMAAEHWNNSVKCALEDEKEVGQFLTFRLEDFLLSPENKIREICEFCGLEFNMNMLPNKENAPGLGTRSYPDRKWYPLKEDVNSYGLERMGEKEIGIIDNVCGGLAEKLGYQKP